MSRARSAADRAAAYGRETAARVPGYDRTLAALDRDRRSGGALLAGALAFRLFAALLPLALLATVALGYAANHQQGAVTDAGDAMGIRASLLQSFAESSKLSSGTRWTVAAFGAAALLWSAMAAARAIRAAHALAWHGAVGQFAKPVQAGLVLIAGLLALAAVWSAVGWAREHLGLLVGLLVAFAAVVPFFGIWLVIASLLPHGEAPWRALVPGALVVAAGLQIIHLGTVLFLTGRVERASATYGSFGAALTILVWLYVISRLIVGSAMLNATLWQRRATGIIRTG